MATKKYTFAEWRKLHPKLSVAQALKSFNRLPATSKTPVAKKPVAKKPVAKPATPPATALPPDPYAQSEANLQAAIGALPATYNAQRQQDAVLAAQNLVAGGYADVTPSQTTQIMQNGQLVNAPVPLHINAQNAGNGDTVYHVVVGADGQLYRQAFQKVAHSNVSRGYSSGFEGGFANMQQANALNAKRASLLQKSDAAQNSSIGKEQSAYTSDIGKLAADYANATSKQTTAAARTPLAPVPTTTVKKPAVRKPVVKKPVVPKPKIK